MYTLELLDRRRRETFPATLQLQTELVDAKVENRELSDALVLVEHEDVYTVGRGEPFQQPVDPRAREIKWIETGRGGKATYHGPGQLVAYPIFDLFRHGKDVHVYLRKLEDVGIDCLAQFDIEAFPREGLTGLWVEDESGYKKIMSIGVGVRRWIAYHGIALNVSTDLRYFRAISACDQNGEIMTSMKEQLAASSLPKPLMADVKNALTQSFLKVFSLQLTKKSRAPRPPWLKVRAPGSPQYLKTREIVKKLKLNTVCEEAHCPNMGECWSHNTATFMIMGDLCTRRCSFCAVKNGTLELLSPLDPLEPVRVAHAIKQLGLEHVVITSVNRDDLEDMGAAHFDQTVRAIKEVNPGCVVELLIPDMRGRRELVETILESGQVSVLNHNVETVPGLYREVRPGAIYQRSLDVLRWAGDLERGAKTKSGVMVGLGETRDEMLTLMDDLRRVGVSIMTIGQYLQPTDVQLPVKRFVTPEEFADYREEGLKRGFSHVESGPLVRSSYHAWKHV